MVVPSLARADADRWLSADLGCGRAAAFGRSARVADLPGCSGRLPKDAPAMEGVLHEAKRRLLDAEDLLGRNKLEKLDALLTQVEADLAHAPPMSPEMPDRWEQAAPLYHRAIASLRNRRRLAPVLEHVRAAYSAALAADKSRNKKDVEGGPTEALKAAQACLAAFSDARSAGVDAKLEVEIEKDHLRPLDDSIAECERVRRTAEPLARAQQQQAKARRAQLRKTLKGERLKAFDAHPAALPELDGAATDLRAAGKAPVWKYTTAAGVEVYTWKGNKRQ
jgi:hypothetical protein